MRKVADLFGGQKRRALWGDASKKERTRYKSFVKGKKISGRTRRLITKAIYCQDLLRAVLAGKRDAATVTALGKKARELADLVRAHEKTPAANLLRNQLIGTYWYGEKVAEIFKKKKLGKGDLEIIEDAKIRLKEEYSLEGIKKQGIEKFLSAPFRIIRP